MRKRVFEIIELASEDDIVSRVYDFTIMIIIGLSIIPMMFKGTNFVFSALDNLVTLAFIVDYILRWITADYKLKKGILSFLIFPFSFMGIVELFCIIPSFRVMNVGFKVLRILRFFIAFRAFKYFRYSNNSFSLIGSVISKNRKSLITVFILAETYIFISALLVFTVEPETFTNFLDAMYWATISLATIGYGDIYPVTAFGKIITMISALVGIAVVALPSGIVTAGYMAMINKQNSKETHIENL